MKKLAQSWADLFLAPVCVRVDADRVENANPSKGQAKLEEIVLLVTGANVHLLYSPRQCCELADSILMRER